MALAIVTGAARGIGAASAVALANAGWDLLLTDVCAPITGIAYPLATQADLDATAQACWSAGVKVEAHAAIDVRDAESLRRVVAGKQLTAAVANAGVIAGGGPAWALNDDVFELDFAINFKGVVNLARAVIPQMLHEGTKGRFVAVISTAGATGLPQLSSYVAAKHAALGYLRALSAEVAPCGITANAVLPGSTDTMLLDATASVYGVDREELVSYQHLQRVIRPEEVGSTIAWVCSPEASAVTGAAIAVDGDFHG